jgi:hypothetical protein
MPDIFISYARENGDQIRKLAHAFQQQGCSVFWDRTIPAGQTWRGYIGDALNNARCVIVAWSRYSVHSHWVIEEADEGLKRGILTPVLLDNIEPPLGFRSLQAADLTDLSSSQSSLEGFVSAVCDRLNSAPIGLDKTLRSGASATDSGGLLHATHGRTQESKHPTFWRTRAVVLIALAAVLAGAILLVGLLRNEDKSSQSVGPPRNGTSPTTTARLPSGARDESLGASNSTLRDVAVIFRNGSRQSLNEVAFKPGTKVCYRGVEVRGAIERAGGLPILQTDRESEELVRRGYCDARTVFLSER